tara:strand:+ start:1352 stop:1501 length:150 start_codon:yes stop_codon:yes gene_type:complete
MNYTEATEAGYRDYRPGARPLVPETWRYQGLSEYYLDGWKLAYARALRG